MGSSIPKAKRRMLSRNQPRPTEIAKHLCTNALSVNAYCPAGGCSLTTLKREPVAVTVINTSGNTSFPTGRRFDLQPGQISTKSVISGRARPCGWYGTASFGRGTTEERDLPLILANLLGFRASDILQSDRSVATIIGSLRNIPVGLLYNTGGASSSSPCIGCACESVWLPAYCPGI